MQAILLQQLFTNNGVKPISLIDLQPKAFCKNHIFKRYRQQISYNPFKCERFTSFLRNASSNFTFVFFIYLIHESTSVLCVSLKTMLKKIKSSVTLRPVCCIVSKSSLYYRFYILLH